MWTQIAGPAVTTQITGPALNWVLAHWVDANATVTFQLVVSDGETSSAPDFVDITIVNSNSPPVADAGDDGTIKEGAVATLDATFSYDDDNDPIAEYRWTQAAGLTVTLLPDNGAAQPTFTAPVAAGQFLVFKLEAHDGKEWSVSSPGADSSYDDTVTIEIVQNSAPVADAGPDQTRQERATVMLDGSGSSDADGGDTLSFSWSQTFGDSVELNDPTTATPWFTAPTIIGGNQSLVFELSVTDDDPLNPKSANDEMVVNVQNVNDPPRCDLGSPVNLDQGSPGTNLNQSPPNNDFQGWLMWAPNHKMWNIGIVGGSDPDNDQVTLTIDGATSDEPVNGLGDGDTGPDAIMLPPVLTDQSLLLRAERSGNENGRVYVIHFTAGDGLESCSGSLAVGVPHSRKSTPIDDGQLYDATAIQ